VIDLSDHTHKGEVPLKLFTDAKQFQEVIRTHPEVGKCCN
jgi:hypothetical protein